MSGRIRKWMGILVCVCILASGLSALAETGKLTIQFGSGGNEGAKFKLYRFADENRKPVIDDDKFKLPEFQEDSKGIQYWTAEQLESFASSLLAPRLDDSIKATTGYDSEATDENGLVVYNDLQPGMYYIVWDSASGPADIASVKPVWAIFPALTDTPYDVTANIPDEKIQFKGSLEIDKEVLVNGKTPTGDNEQLLDGTYNFKVEGPNGYSAAVSIKIEKGKMVAPVVLSNLRFGEYKVTEELTDKQVGKFEVVNSGTTRTLNADSKSATVTIVNKTNVPSPSPSPSPSASPSRSPSASPSTSPSRTPTTTTTTPSKTSNPPTRTANPPTSAPPSESPSASPSASPSVSPSGSPSESPSASPSVSPSNSAEAEETPKPYVNVDVRKIWKDDGNEHLTRPARITVELYRNDQLYEVATFGGNANGWFHRFSRLPINDEFGNAYSYDIGEIEVEGYTTEVNHETRTITNTLIDKKSTQKTDYVGRKVWDDNNNEDGERPTSIVVRLLRNGKETNETRTVTAATDWEFSFKGLDYDDGYGNVNTYAVREDSVNGYIARIDGAVITNYRQPSPKEYEYFDVPGTPLAGFENETEESLEEMVELFDYMSPLWGEQLLPTGDEVPIYPFVFGGIGVIALAALVILMAVNRKKQNQKV